MLRNNTHHRTVAMGAAFLISMTVFGSQTAFATPFDSGLRLATLAPRAILIEDDEDTQSLTPVKKSTVVPITLPEGAMRFQGKKQVGQFTDALRSMAKEAKLTVSGETEVLLWRGGAAAKKAVPGLLKEGGYAYVAKDAIEKDGGKITPFLANREGRKSGALGLWIEQGENLMLVWAKSGAEGESADEDAGKEGDEAPGGSITHRVDAATNVLNVMGKTAPKMPTFPKVTVKPGVARGYVYDTKGKPVVGARIGVRSTAAGGFYSGAQAKTDAKGYYEIAAPAGAAHFYNAGAAVDYGDGIAALGLHPADGELDSFATPNGTVENFVLMPYGITDRAAVQDDPRYNGNYYGGALVLGWSVNEGRPLFDSPKNLPNDSEFEVTLTPDGPLLDGSKGKVIVIRKAVSASVFGQLYVNNIPAGTYKIAARMVGGEPLKMRETGPNGSKPFGLSPKEASGNAALLFRPSTAKPEMVTAAKGSWDRISINLER